MSGEGVKLRVTTTKEYEVTFLRADLLGYICGRPNRFPYDLPANASVTVHVPGGGDWSNQVLDVDDAGGLKVRWTVTETK